MSHNTADPARPLRAIIVMLSLWVTGRTAYLVVTRSTAATVSRDISESARRRPVSQQATALPDIAAQPIRLPVPPSFHAAVLGPHSDSMPRRIFPTRNVATHQELASGPATPPNLSAALPAFPLVSDPVEVSGSTISGSSISGLATYASTFRSGWSGSIWINSRDGAVPGLASGNGQLGGSQGGIRVYRHLTKAISVTARASSALATRQAEGSAGVAVRRGAFALLVERRFALDRGGRNAWSVTAVTGVSDVALPIGLRMGGYAQAGVVGRDAFADGAVQLERPVLKAGRGRLSLGVGSWGSIQPGLARLDLGPQLVARAVIGGRSMRVSAEWRQRIAGNATPGSGPAVTLGADF